MDTRFGHYATKTVLVLVGLSFLYPFVWMLMMSLKTTEDIYNHPFALPAVIEISNYTLALKSFDFARLFSNSLVYSFGTIAITIVFASMFSYCTARMNWRWGKAALSYVALGLVIPVQVVIIPIFMLLKTLHIRNTFLGLVLPYSAFALSSAALMLYAFFRTMPRELEESASLDGCNVYQSFWHIIVPIVRPAIVAQVVIIFMNTWNEFFMSFILVTSEKMKSLPIGLMNFFMNTGTTQWGQIGAVMVLSSIPTVLVYILFSEQIEKALTAGAILK